jgi:hypothetical protein
MNFDLPINKNTSGILSVWAKQNYFFVRRPTTVIPGENFAGVAYT